MQIIGQIGTEHLLGGKVGSHAIARTGRHKRRLERRCLLHIGNRRGQRVGTRDLVRQRALSLILQEVELLAGALRVVLEATLAIDTLAPLAYVTYLTCHETLQVSRVVVPHRPRLSVANVCIVVVAILITLLNNRSVAISLVVVQVVLHHALAYEIALGILIDVDPIVATQQILHLLIVLGAVVARIKTHIQTMTTTQRLHPLHLEVGITLVGMTLLDHIVRAAQTIQTLDLRILGHVTIVIIIEAIPIDLAGTPIRAPRPTNDIGLLVIALTLEVAGQIAIVVGTRIGTIVPIKSRVTVATKTIRHRRHQSRGGRGRKVVVEHCDRLVEVTDTGIALLVDLITPIRVIVVAAHHIVDLLSRGILHATLGRCTQHGQRKTVATIQSFLDRCEVTVSVVVGTIDPIVTALTGRERESVGPTIVEHTRRIAYHHTETVVVVGIDHTRAEALTHLRRTSIDIGHTADTTYTIIRNTQR